MASTAAFRITGTIFGLPEGDERFDLTMSNSTAAYQSMLVGATTVAATPTTITISTDARFMLIVPPSTNNLPLRIKPSSAAADLGVPLSSILPSLISLTPGTSVMFLFTTGTTAVSNIRIITA